MTQEEFLLKIARDLASVGISFMITGSLSSSLHGRPRATNDVDIVIDATVEQLEHFLSALGANCYVSPAAAQAALQDRSMFNVVDTAGGWKADLIIRKDRPFSIEEFQRKKTNTLLGSSLPVASAEDVILSKLEWDKLTPSERQVQDALNVAVVQGTRLDRQYLRTWASALGVSEKLEDVLREVDKLQRAPTLDQS